MERIFTVGKPAFKVQIRSCFMQKMGVLFCVVFLVDDSFTKVTRNRTLSKIFNFTVLNETVMRSLSEHYPYRAVTVHRM